MEYLDLYLIHTPFSAAVAEPQALQRAWAAMEALQAAGKVRSIGVSNFHAPHLATILETAKVKPAINQVEFHPYLQHKALQSLLHEHGIVLAAYGPLTAVTKAAPGPVDEILQRLARKYNVTAGEICLRWCVEQGVVAVTTSSKEDRLRQYLKATAFRMTPREVAEISEAGEGKHYRGFFTDKFAADDRS